MLMSRRGEWPAEVRRPTWLPPMCTGQKSSSHMPSGGPSIVTPTSLRLTPSVLIFSSAVAGHDLVVVVELHEPLEAGDLVRVVGDVHVVAVVEDPRLEATLIARRGHAQLELLAGVDDGVPQLECPTRVAQVHLVAELGGPPGPRDRRPGCRCSSVCLCQ